MLFSPQDLHRVMGILLFKVIKGLNTKMRITITIDTDANDVKVESPPVPVPEPVLEALADSIS